MPMGDEKYTPVICEKYFDRGVVGYVEFGPRIVMCIWWFPKQESCLLASITLLNNVLYSLLSTFNVIDVRKSSNSEAL